MEGENINSLPKEFKFIVPEKVKEQLTEAINRFGTFSAVLGLMVKNGVNIGKLPEKLNNFNNSGKELLEEINKLPGK